MFLGLNGVDLDAPDDEAYDTVIAVATGEADVRSVAETLRRWRAA